MLLSEMIFTRSLLLLIFCGLDFGLLAGSYSILHTLRVPVNQVTWLLGGGLIIIGLSTSLMVLFPNLSLPLPALLVNGGLSGAFAFAIAVYAAGQWLARQQYIWVKRRGDKSLRQSSKELLIFLRKHHQFFGWIIVATSLGHTLFFLPSLQASDKYKAVTGLVALGLLALLVILGSWLWIERSWLKHRMPKAIYALHSLLTIAFFIALFLHI